ncbi:carbohydrate ABC transporter permease [Fredinandcohnia quinoae]|uniref:Sugar ABC transporter permease n=1 Tax=Fredinandcohnia quinoae TaxID=2918902 RepID=A0AAW5DU59_9BACI|nr:sugar ABC transporter permease [Fredinandcohnia sp. SECRCQ15]MCH1624167.1 sugar ABC transporter permease [Fredinandcohnia sp. SECRCQ15]
MNNKSLSYWVFLAPCLLALFLVLILPLAYGVYYSFTDFNGFTINTFVGLDNYTKLFSDTQFLKSLWFTAKFSVVAVIGVNIIGMALALLVTQKMGKLSTVFRTIYFMPNLIGGIVLGFIWQFVFIKAFTAIGEMTGIELFNGWLASEATGFWGLVILFLWQMSGYIMIIYISFLNNIPHELMEAAEIDGASAWQKFWKIKFPLIAPAFTISLFLTLSNAFKVYDQNLALTAGGPFGSTEMAAMNIYNTAFKIQDMGYAQSKAIIFLFIIALISVIQIYVTRKRETDL